MGSRNRKKLAVEKRNGLSHTHIDTLRKEVGASIRPKNDRNRRFREGC